MFTKPKPQNSEPQMSNGAPASQTVPKMTVVMHEAADMEAVTAILGRLLKPEAIQPWLHKKVPSLGYRRPVEMIRNGEVAQVIEVLARLEEGIYL